MEPKYIWKYYNSLTEDGRVWEGTKKEVEDMYKPGYLGLLKNGELQNRVIRFKSMLESCVLCPHQCRVNRTKGERGYCKTLDKAVVSGAQAHFGEERELVGRYGSGT